MNKKQKINTIDEINKMKKNLVSIKDISLAYIKNNINK